MINSKLTLFSFLLICTVALTGCKKEEGPMGPQGPAGANGNANVQSEMITALSSDWESINNIFVATKQSSVITENIAMDGAVLCYMVSTDGTTYTPLPRSVYIPDLSVTAHLSFTYNNEGQITLSFQIDSSITLQPGDIKYKVVAIESRMTELYPNITEMPYEEVMEIVGSTE